MTGRHAATGQDRDRPRPSAFWDEGTRDRVADAAAVICGAGVALTGTELDGLAGAGVVLGGVAVPAVWMSLSASRLRRRLRSEQAARRRSSAMAAAQDARIQSLRQRVRELDLAQAESRDELRIATTGLAATQVELAAMRSELDEARGDLGQAREQLVQVRDQLAALLSVPRAAAPQDDAEASAPAAAGGRVSMFQAADPLQDLVLPAGLSRSESLAPAEPQTFEPFAESDLDDLTGILSVSAMLDHARQQERQQELARARGLADGSGDDPLGDLVETPAEAPDTVPAGGPENTTDEDAPDRVRAEVHADVRDDVTTSAA